MEYYPFKFLGGHVDLGEETEVELVEGHFIKKANEVQLKYIKTGIELIGEGFLGDSLLKEQLRLIHEGKPIIEGNGNTKYVELERNDWEYLVVECRDNKRVQVDYDLQLTLLLSKLSNMRFIFDFSITPNQEFNNSSNYPFAPYNFGRSGEITDQFANEHAFIPFPKVSLTKRDITEIKDIFTLIKKFKRDDTQNEYLKKALLDIRNLPRLPYYSPLRYLFVFSIIECLLVNQNRPISKQLSSKIKYINNRYEEPLDISLYFTNNDTKIETLIEKLYSYRSDIAHGDFSDFDRELKVIGDNKKAYNFLYELLKKVVVYALKDPKLVKDLKDI